MGSTLSVRPGSALAQALASSATSITVNNAGTGGLDYAQGETVRIFNNANPASVIDFQMNDANTDATVVGGAIDGLSAAASDAASGSLVANLEATKALVENTDFVIDYTAGAVRFLGTAATPASATLAVAGNFRSSSKTRIGLGKALPTLEVSVRLVHTYPDKRVLSLILPKVALTAENPSLEFAADDWIGVDLSLEVLATEDAQYADYPFGYFEIDNTAQGTPVIGTDTYTVGSFELFITPLTSAGAAARGFTQAEINVGCVRVGTLEGTSEYLKHYCGTPKRKDKVVLLQKEMTLTATLDDINVYNIAMVFDGSLFLNPSGGAVAPFMSLVTVPANIATPEGQATWVPMSPYVGIDPS